MHNMNKNKLYLKDLPKNITYILLKENFKKQFFKTFLKYFNNQPAQAEKWLETKRKNIQYWKSKGGNFVYKNKRKVTLAYTPLWAILKISKFLVIKGYKKYSMKNIEKKLVAYRHKKGSSVFNPKFPINLETEEAAIVCAAILCDGGINKNGYPMYNNSEECMRIKVVNAINRLIGNIHTNALKPYKNIVLYSQKF